MEGAVRYATRQARQSRMRPALDFRVKWVTIGALTMILVLRGGLYAIEQVSGTWRNVKEADRIAREYLGR